MVQTKVLPGLWVAQVPRAGRGEPHPPPDCPGPRCWGVGGDTRFCRKRSELAPYLAGEPSRFCPVPSPAPTAKLWDRATECPRVHWGPRAPQTARVHAHQTGRVGNIGGADKTRLPQGNQVTCLPEITSPPTAQAHAPPRPESQSRLSSWACLPSWHLCPQEAHALREAPPTLRAWV